MIFSACSKKPSEFLKELKYAFYLTVHPFKGFWEIKKEGKGSAGTATLILLSYLIVTVLSGLYTGYLFISGDAADFNAAKAVFKVLLLFFGFCIANWCFTCLFDGEGSFRDIYKATAYALLPMIWVQIVLIPLSNYFLLTEQSFYATVYGIAMVWTLFLIVIGVLVTHQYGFGKTLVSMACIVVGMCALAYVALLFFNLMQQVFGFVATVIQEIALHQ